MARDRPKKKSKNSIVLPTKPTRSATGLRDYIEFFYGPPGVGKTSFVDGFGDVLFLSTDRGTRFLKTKRVECLEWPQFKKVLDKLEAPDAPHYDFICVDHVDDMVNMLETYYCKKWNVESLTDRSLPWGKGWNTFKREIRDFTQRIMRLGTGIVYIAHEKIVTVKVGVVEKQQWMPDMSKMAWKIMIPTADLVGFIDLQTIKNKETKKRETRRMLTTQPTPEIYAKDRTAREKPSKGVERLDPDEFMASFGDSDHGKAQQEGDEGSDEEQGQARGGRRGRGR